MRLKDLVGNSTKEYFQLESDEQWWKATKFLKISEK